MVRRRALVGQLLLVATGVGVFIGGVVISTVGLAFVFVPTDLEFMHTDAATLEAANAHLVPFVAHDRAASAARSWRRRLRSCYSDCGVGDRVRHGVVDAARCGPHRFGKCAVIHYTAFVHLLPVYFGSAMLAVALILARRI
ncbi:hypothetical protein ACQPXH_09900 [Nocardia sp. CA-135953]|uniref:hypothetical protein n=1 Tax=Nocardia sp. CA-135953 TaxID=3239978 RepID=UPI003D976E23